MTLEEWNLRYPVGTAVVFRPAPSAPGRHTRTVGRAYRLTPDGEEWAVPLGSGAHARFSQMEPFEVPLGRDGSVG